MALYSINFNLPTGDITMPFWVIPMAIISVAVLIICLAIRVVINQRRK